MSRNSPEVPKRRPRRNAVSPVTARRPLSIWVMLFMLGRPVDLVTDKALRPELRPYVEREAIRV